MSAYRALSVLTLIRGRQHHFDNMLAGLAAQTRQPDELVVAYMQDDPPTISGDPLFPIRWVQVAGDELPLARARNRAAEIATGDNLAFLDVDCIADKHFVRRVSEALEVQQDGIYLPEVRYLPASGDGWLDEDGLPDYSRLESHAVRHPAKPPVFDEATVPIGDYGELWGLAFALANETWRSAGGMDEQFEGYGAEETDFGRRLAAISAPMFWLGGTLCFHQHHTVHKPPLQHFGSIIRNARLYREKWGEWCMTYWLDDFELRGLIERGENTLKVVRQPSEAEIEATRQGPEIRFS